MLVSRQPFDEASRSNRTRGDTCGFVLSRRTTQVQIIPTRIVRRALPALLGVAVLLLTLSTQAEEKPAPDPVGGKIRWVYDYQRGQLASRETGKPMFVVFRCER